MGFAGRVDTANQLSREIGGIGRHHWPPGNISDRNRSTSSIHDLGKRHAIRRARRDAINRPAEFRLEFAPSPTLQEVTLTVQNGLIP